MRRAAKVDENQSAIVAALRQLPGVTVEVGHDDILVGYRGRTYWFEIKRPDAVSRKTGEVKPSQLTESERKRLATWCGHYAVVWDSSQIIEALASA